MFLSLSGLPVLGWVTYLSKWLVIYFSNYSGIWWQKNSVIISNRKIGTNIKQCLIRSNLKKYLNKESAVKKHIFRAYLIFTILTWKIRNFHWKGFFHLRKKVLVAMSGDRFLGCCSSSLKQGYEVAGITMRIDNSTGLLILLQMPWG